MLNLRIFAIIILIASVSITLGAYVGYQRGVVDSNLDLDPLIGHLTEQVANVTAENEALRKTIPSITGKTVRIGYIAGETTQLTITMPPMILPCYSIAKPFIEQVIQPDLNAYATSIGSDVRFEFITYDAEGQAAQHLEQVQKLYNSGVDIFIGGEWSSHAGASLSYVNANKMLMMSPRSMSPTLAIPGDRFYRMCPADLTFGPALANVIWSYGIKELVVIQRGDAYGDGVLFFMEPEYSKLGGRIAGPKIRYPDGVTDYFGYLEQASIQAEDAIIRQGNVTDSVGVLFLALDEAPSVLMQVSQFEVLYDLTWFGGDTTANSQEIIDGSPAEAVQLKLLSPSPRFTNSSIYASVESRFVEATSSEFSIYYAYLYDAAMVLGRAIIETGSDNATEVAVALPAVCGSSFGASGWLNLNEFGDRDPPPYDVLYYSNGVAEPVGSNVAGTYFPDTKAVIWDKRFMNKSTTNP